jgi:twinkle protein
MYRWSDFNINVGEDNLELTEGILEAGCPKCSHTTQSGRNTLYINMGDQSWFCKHCGFAGNLLQGSQIVPQNGTQLVPWRLNPYIHEYVPTSNLSKSAIENFKKKKISESTLAHFKIGQTKTYFPQLENNMNCIVYPYYQNHQVVNLVYFYGKHRNSEIGGVETCFNYDKIDLEHTYLVFDELEVFTFYESGIENVISLFGGLTYDKDNFEKSSSRALEFLQNIEDKVNKIKKITLALPNNDVANHLKDELLRRLGKERCWVVQPPENNYSWNDVFSEYGKHKMTFLLDTAKPIPVRGIFEIDDIEEKFDDLYYKGLKRGALSGWPTLDEYYTVVPGQWTVVTGIPGHGKSNFLDALFVNLAKWEDWKFAIFSPENQPLERHFANIMEKYFEQPFDVGKMGRISEDQKEDGKAWLKKHFSVILPHEDDSWSIDGVLSLAKVLVFRKGIKGLVIDPWNELDHSRPSNQTETEYISSTLTKIRQFARNYNVHVWLVAHPAKLYKDKDGKYPVPTPYDISGSAHYRNKADNAITVWRNVGHEDQSCSDIHVQKIRFKEVGKVGLVSLRYDFISGAFIDDIDQDKRRKALEDGEVIPTEKLRKRY